VTGCAANLVTNSELLWWYKKYNRKYFGGKLPAIKIKFSKLAVNTLAEVWYEEREIYISNWIKTSDLLVRMNILHEMVHLSLPVGCHHGPKFEKEMLRLAKAGAFRGIW
jgi:hypothetical protein